MNIAEINEQGRELNHLLILRYSPIALKLLGSEDEIPADSVRPSQKEGHLAMCQAFAMVRRERRAITMLKEDHWCVWPLVSYGLVELDEEDIEKMGRLMFFEDRLRVWSFCAANIPA